MSTLLLRIAVALILLVHGIGGMFNNGVNDFGNLYLNQVGFAPLGLYIAWAIKISHVIAAILLVLNTYLKLVVISTVFVLIMGIIMVHFKEGWFVVGAGRNGVEFNFILICTLITILFPNGFVKKSSNEH